MQALQLLLNLCCLCSSSSAAGILVPVRGRGELKPFLLAGACQAVHHSFTPQELPQLPGGSVSDKSALSFMSGEGNAQSPWQVSPLTSLISHSSLDAFLKDHRNVGFKTCLANFLHPEAYALNLGNFHFSIALWNRFLFLLG